MALNRTNFASEYSVMVLSLDHRKMEKANTLLATGKRNYAADDFQNAVDLLSDSCQLLLVPYLSVFIFRICLKLYFVVSEIVL